MMYNPLFQTLDYLDRQISNNPMIRYMEYYHAYIAPEVLNGEPYALSSGIYSFGVVMTELSSGKPPYCNRNHDFGLSLAICDGLRPEFGKGTPDIYKKLAYRCMNANSDERPTIDELHDAFRSWYKYAYIDQDNYQTKEHFDHKEKEIKDAFNEAD